MTSSLPPKSRQAGFTMIELMVVIGIIVLLATIALPMMSRAYAQAKRTQMAADLQVISGALEAYRADFGDYPRRRTTDVNGASLLCWALVAPGPQGDGQGNPPGSDGADGPGFRIRGTTGTVKGPYLAPDRFTVGVIMVPSIPVVATTTSYDNRRDVLADRYYHPILYFPANKTADPSAAGVDGGAFINSGTNAQAVFNYADSFSDAFQAGFGISTAPNQLTPKVMAFRLGNADGSGTLKSTDTPSATGPYLLWAAGPDGFFGANDSHGGQCDDVVDNGASVQLNTTVLPPGIYP